VGILLVFSASLLGATLRVPSQYATIQAGIDAAGSEDTVLVAAGTYSVSPPLERIVRIYNRNGLTLLSESGRESTILADPACNDPVWLYQSSNITIRGFTIMSALRTNIGVSASSDIKITECNITDAVTGVYIDSSSNGVEISNSSMFRNDNGISTTGFDVIISKNRVYENMQNIAFDGGAATITENDIYGALEHGIRMDLGWEASILIESNIVHDNAKTGLRFYSTYTNPAIIENNTITGNGSYGVFVIAGEPHISQNIISANVSAGVAVGEGGNPYITCNDVWGNSHFTNGNYVGYITDQTGCDGNISTDPFFCNSSGGDFSVAANSPALHANCGIMGAIATPGCGNQTAVQQVSWGAIKALYK
jgi:hypothetical protein